MRLPSLPCARCLALLAAAVIASACGDGSGPTPPLTGSYTLRTLDGRALPTTYACGDNVSSGTLAVTPDSLVLRLTTGEGSSASTREMRRGYTLSSDRKRLVSPDPYGGTTPADTATVTGGGGVTYRAWLPVNAACTGTNGVQADLGFRHD